MRLSSFYGPAAHIRWLRRVGGSIALLFIVAGFLPAAAIPAAQAAGQLFAYPTLLSNNRGMYGLAVGDFTGDGALDMFVGGFSASVYVNDGKGHFGLPRDAGFCYSAIVAADFNGDGALDVACNIFDAGDNLIYLNDGRGYFPRALSIPQGGFNSAMAAGDFNGDGAVDLVSANGFPASQVNMNIGDGSGNLAAPTPLPGSDGSEDVAVGDFNGDGALDLVFGNNQGHPSQIYLNKNDGSAGFQTPVPLPDHGGAAHVLVGDLNGDGALDLVATSDRAGAQPSRVYLNKNDGSGNFDAPIVLSGIRAGYQGPIDLGDVNSDGRLDIVLPGAGPAGQVILNEGLGHFGAPIDLPGQGGAGVSTAVLADFNGDGALDLVTGNGDKPSRIYLNLGAAPFADPSELLGGTIAGGHPIARDVVVGDVNGDGALDLVTSNDTNNADAPVAVYLNKNDSSGAFAAPNPIPDSTSSFSQLTLGDLDGDGALDLVLSNRVASKVFRNDGSGGFSVTQILQDSAESMALGDLNGDGALDLVALQEWGASQVYLNDRAGGLGAPKPIVGSYPPDAPEFARTTGMTIGDVNGDGALDLVFAYDWRPAQIFLNDGIGGFAAPLPLGDDSSIRSRPLFGSIALGDLNGDGALDLVLPDFGSSTEIYMNKNDGTGRFAKPVSLQGSDGGSVAGVALGDLNGDGALDLVLGNAGNSSQVYLNKNDESGALNTPALIPGSSLQTNQLALGDFNGDGALDLVLANGDPSQVYLNWLGRARSLPNNPPAIAIERPGPTADANFYATPAIFTQQAIPIHYRLFDAEDDPVGALRAFYSLDGGGDWRPAVAATGTITTNLATSPAGVAHTFKWDTFASGVFGQSDNVVFRIEAFGIGSGNGRNDPLDAHAWSHTVLLPYVGNSLRPSGVVSGPYQRPYASATTFPFRVRGTQVRVVRDGTPAAGALVYRLPSDVDLGGAPLGSGAGGAFHTDSGGYLLGRGEVRPGDRLLAVAPISSTASYTLYATNGTPTPVGTDTFTVTASGVQTLAVSLDHPLILFNIDVSLEWDASSSPSYLQQLQFNLQRASQYLYDFTDGQVALGRITVHQNADDWAFSDVVIHATNRLRPFAAQGGIVLTPTVDPQQPDIVYDTGQVHIGATWNRYGAAGQSLGDDWSIILAHELSHYLLYQDDSYLGLNADGFLVAVRSCTGSAMGDLYTSPDATEFVADQAHWNAACADTLANQTLHRTEWQTIDTWYPALHQPAAINSGPGTMPFDLTGVSVAPPITPTQALADPTFYLDYANEQTSSNEAHAFLERDGKYIVDVGSPFGGQNRLLAHGAQPGDRLCVFDRPRQQFGCETIALGDDRLALRQDASWAPIIQLTPVTSRTFDLAVEGLPAGLTLNARLFPEFGPGSTVIGLAQVGSVYTGSFQLDEPALAGNVQMWANEPATEEQPRRETIVSYSVGGNPGQSRGGGGQSRGGGGQSRGGGGQSRGGGGQSRGGGAPLVSPDGQMIFFTPNPIVFQPGQFYTIQGTAGLPPLPLGKTVIGQSGSLVATAGTPVITGSISFQYLESDVLVAGVNESQLTIHFWDGTTWRALATIRDPYVNLASARSQGPGIYALMAGVSTARIESITPAWATNDTTTTLTIHGSGFLPPVRVSLAGPDTTYTLPVTSAFSTTVTTVISAGLEAREYQLVITNGDGGSSAPVPFALYSPSSARFYDFFESGAGKWQLDGEWGIVALPDGNRAMTDSPAGNYNSAIPPAATRTTQITSQPFSLDALANPVLTFRHDYVLARLGSSQDIARVEISTDNGATWATLASYSGGGIYGAAAGPQDAPDLEWTNVNWKNVSINLSGYSGTVRLRFSLEVDQTVSDKGWVIDDVMVRSGP